MKHRKLQQLAVVTMSTAVFTISWGCGILDDLLDDLPVTGDTPFTIVGEKGNKVLLAVARTADGLFEGGDWYPPPAGVTSDIYSVDLDTLDTELVMAGIDSAWELSVVADDRWVAWVDREESNLTVVNRDTGEETRYLEGYTSYPETNIRDGGLIASRWVGSSVDDDEFVLLDFVAQTETPLHDTDGSAFAFDGERLALTGIRAAGSYPIVPYSVLANVDVMDLATGERQTVASDIDGYIEGLYFGESRLVWQQCSYRVNSCKLRTYNFDSGRVTTVADSFSSNNDYAYLIDVDGDVGLVEVTRFAPFRRETVLRAMALDGDANEIIVLPDEAILPWRYWPQPRFVGDFILWADTQTGKYVIYDRESGNTRQFDPWRVLGH